MGDKRVNRTERVEEAEIEAVLEAERNICNHPVKELGWSALDFIRDREGEPLPILERPEAGQLRYTIRD